MFQVVTEESHYADVDELSVITNMLHRGQRTGVEPLKLAIFHLMQRHLSDMLRCVSVCNIYVTVKV